MTVTPRQREKLESIGYRVRRTSNLLWDACSPNAKLEETGGVGEECYRTEDDALAACWAHCSSPEGMILTHSDKERWLCDNGWAISVWRNPSGFSAEASMRGKFVHADGFPPVAIHSLFEKVP